MSILSNIPFVGGLLDGGGGGNNNNPLDFLNNLNPEKWINMGIELMFLWVGFSIVLKLIDKI